MVPCEVLYQHGDGAWPEDGAAVRRKRISAASIWNVGHKEPLVAIDLPVVEAFEKALHTAAVRGHVGGRYEGLTVDVPYLGCGVGEDGLVEVEELSEITDHGRAELLKAVRDHKKRQR